MSSAFSSYLSPTTSSLENVSLLFGMLPLSLSSQIATEEFFSHALTGFLVVAVMVFFADSDPARAGYVINHLVEDERREGTPKELYLEGFIRGFRVDKGTTRHNCFVLKVRLLRTPPTKATLILCRLMMSTLVALQMGRDIEPSRLSRQGSEMELIILGTSFSTLL